MCNIAAYAGERQAAPILIDMLRRQEAFDGYMGTGIVTIHEGKLHVRKVIGNTDVLIRETDALSLPGTVGIIHARSGGKDISLVHPHLSADGSVALVTNGTNPNTPYTHFQNEAAEMLEAAGVPFATKRQSDELFPRISTGEFVFSVELRALLVDYYHKQGKSMTEAMALTSANMYCDNVTLSVSADEPDKVFALRTTRPMIALFGKGETFLSTTRFGLPEGVHGESMALPLMQSCYITKNGLTVTGDRFHVEDVSPITPYAYKEAYQRIEAMLLGKQDNPLYFDNLELAVGNDMKDIWPEQHTLNQHAALVYDILYQLHTEGRLRFTMGATKGGNIRYYMWIDN